MENALPSDTLLSEKERRQDSPGWFEHDDVHQRRRSSIRLVILYLLTATSLILNAVLAVLFFSPLDVDQLSIEHTQQYWSPIIDEIRIDYKPVMFDGTVFGSNLYREDASDEVDKAWSDLGLENSHVVEESEAKRVGFSPGQVKLKPEEGGGFMTQLEVFHQLHCLDTLRQGLYFNFDYYHTNRKGVWGRSDELVRKHMGHCLDQLRLQLQCTADTSVVGLTWVNTSLGEPTFFPQFNRVHKCRDFEAIREWSFANDRKGHVKWRPGDDLLSEFP